MFILAEIYAKNIEIFRRNRRIRNCTFSTIYSRTIIHKTNSLQTIQRIAYEMSSFKHRRSRRSFRPFRKDLRISTKSQPYSRCVPNGLVTVLEFSPFERKFRVQRMKKSRGTVERFSRFSPKLVRREFRSARAPPTPPQDSTGQVMTSTNQPRRRFPVRPNLVARNCRRRRILRLVGKTPTECSLALLRNRTPFENGAFAVITFGVHGETILKYYPTGRALSFSPVVYCRRGFGMIDNNGRGTT